MQTLAILATLADSGLDMVERTIVALPSVDVPMGEDHDAHVTTFEALYYPWLHRDGSAGWSSLEDDYADRFYSDPEEEEREHEHQASMGDPRRCPRHPHVQTSDPWGMFDAPCGECEYEMENDPISCYADFMQGIAAHFSRICNDGLSSDESIRAAAHVPMCEDLWRNIGCFTTQADCAAFDIPF